MNKYTGVGARKTPQKILCIMEACAKKLSKSDYILRSGGAIGADKAFQKGSLLSEIYYASDATEKAFSIAKEFHPAWNCLSEYAKMLHARNSFQVLGKNLNEKSNFLLCWTKDGCIKHADRTISTGGTGTAISIADKYNVPIYNLKRDSHLTKILKWLN